MMSGDIMLRPDLTFTDGTAFRALPDLWALAQAPLPTEAEIDLSNAFAEARRLIVAAVVAELSGARP